MKLLRVLQENEIRPVGDSKTMKVDVRVIAATAKNLEEEVRNGKFREDLFYRLNVLAIKLPPLKARPEDVPLLSQHFIHKFNVSLGKDIKGITPAGMSLLLKHDWPGNVRELENVIERAMVLAEQPYLLPESFSLKPGSETTSGALGDLVAGYSLKEAQKALEKLFITRALQATKGNRTQAAQLLEISHPSLLSKMRAYEIDL